MDAISMGQWSPDFLVVLTKVNQRLPLVDHLWTTILRRELRE